MYQSYDLSRYVDGDLSQSNSFTVSDHDTVNCAHMLASGFNTMSRNFMGDFVLAVVDTKAGTVQYDGKIEKIDRPDPHTVSTTMHFKASPDAQSLLTFFGDEGTYTMRGNVEIQDDHEAVSKRLAREVLESAYAELQAVKEVLAVAGVETIPADAGVTDLRAVLRARDLQISELVQERANANAAARAELIKYVRGAYLKKERLTVDEVRQDLEDRFRGVLDVFAKFLVVTGEADADEGHAVARRLCGISDE
jgi:hypothetical protein